MVARRQAKKPSSTSLSDRYVEALLRGDGRMAGLIVQEALRSRWDAVRIYMEVFYPALVEIGNLWCKAKINVAQEHLATQITLVQMGQLRSAHQPIHELDYRAVVAAVEQEQHYLGAMMVADVLGFEGWQVDFLGPDVPTADLLSILSKRRVHLLALSVTIPAHLAHLERIGNGLRKLPRAPKVIVGGAALAGRPDAFRAYGFQTAENSREAVLLARRLFGFEEDRFSLDIFLKELGQRVRDLRIQRGWTQQQLAEKSNMDRTYIIAVEFGKQNLSIGVVMKIAKALNVPIERFLSGGRSEEANKPL
jgi:methanogenic corrinoid protein MtbC1/DNA-binding XRE family transcriptional regulator